MGESAAAEEPGTRGRRGRREAFLPGRTWALTALRVGSK
jgi:hypothetical protein